MLPKTEAKIAMNNQIIGKPATNNWMPKTADTITSIPKSGWIINNAATHKNSIKHTLKLGKSS